MKVAADCKSMTNKMTGITTFANSKDDEKKINEETVQCTIESKASFQGYGIWAMPKDKSRSQMECSQTMDKFRTRFPPILYPKWNPHISIAAGISDKEVAIEVAQKLAAEFSKFAIDLSPGQQEGGIDVDGETPEDRAAVYFCGQRLRAGWIQPSVNSGAAVNDYGEDLLASMCRRGRELLGGETQTTNFEPHLSIFYFDKDELDGKQRTILKDELNVHFKGKESISVESIFVASTEGKPGDWRILEGFPLQK